MALRAIMTTIVIGLIFGAITLVLWEGADDVAAGRLSGGAIAAFVLTGGLVAGAFGSLSESWGDLLRGAGAASRLDEILVDEQQNNAVFRDLAKDAAQGDRSVHPPFAFRIAAHKLAVDN